MVAVATVGDHRLQAGASGGEIAVLERAPRLVEALVAAALRFRDRPARGRETANRFGTRRLDERHSAEHQGRFTRVAGLEQPPALGKQTLDPLAVGGGHSMCPRTLAVTLSEKA